MRFQTSIYWPFTSHAFSAISLSACQKEHNSNVLGTDANGIPKSSCVSKVTLECGGTILAFDDQAEYDDVLSCLQSEFDTWNAHIESLYGYLNEEDYNSTLDGLGIDEEQPLIDFEDYLHFYSYRRHFSLLEDQWLADGMDMNNDPDDLDQIDDPIQSTLFSGDGAIQIGGTIHWVDKDGNWYSIPSGDCSLLVALMADPSIEHPGILKIDFHCFDPCMCKKKLKGHDDHNNKRVKWKVKNRCPWMSDHTQHRVVMKTYKKILWIFWKRWRVVGEAKLYGTHQDFYCSPDVYHESNDVGRRSRFHKTWDSSTTHPCIADDETCGYFDWPHGTYAYCLDWM